MAYSFVGRVHFVWYINLLPDQLPIPSADIFYDYGKYFSKEENNVKKLRSQGAIFDTNSKQQR